MVTAIVRVSTKLTTLALLTTAITAVSAGFQATNMLKLFVLIEPVLLLDLTSHSLHTHHHL